ncbi:MAG: hypothetical protein GF344_04975, partial [Chitinivibrionales bacterium]|nr:hypothetical protein [Chitinivibrionales bacterium]MBD3356353.1 hypothetical protein [Chitinivibrionales bacterium]
MAANAVTPGMHTRRRFVGIRRKLMSLTTKTLVATAVASLLSTAIPAFRMMH